MIFSSTRANAETGFAYEYQHRVPPPAKLSRVAVRHREMRRKRSQALLDGTDPDADNSGVTLGLSDSSASVPTSSAAVGPGGLPTVMSKEAVAALKGRSASAQWRMRAQLLKQSMQAGAANPLLRTLNQQINSQLEEYDRREPKAKPVLTSQPPARALKGAAKDAAVPDAEIASETTTAGAGAKPASSSSNS